MRRCLIGIVSSEIEHVAIIWERRDGDRPRRHQRLPCLKRRGYLSQIIVPVRIPDQIPPTRFKLAVTNIDDALPVWRCRLWPYECLEADEQQVFALIIMNLDHVVVGGK